MLQLACADQGSKAGNEDMGDHAGCTEGEAPRQPASPDSGCQAQPPGVCPGHRPADQAQVTAGATLSTLDLLA